MEPEDPNAPWLLAAWPGLGNVAVHAAAHLINSLEGIEPIGEISGQPFFDMQHIEVQQGIARAPGLPRSRIFRWRNTGGGRDILIFLGEAQPVTGGHALCRELIDFAAKRDVGRVVTMAALATQLHPQEEPKVRACVTAPALLPDLRKEGIATLDEGQIGGLNGVALAAALERGIPGMCITAEIPFFAAGVPNLKASLAALRAFCTLSGVHVNLTPLAEQAEAVTNKIMEMLERMKGAAAEEAEPPLPEPEIESAEEQPEPPARRQLSLEARERIERLFEEARQDRSRAFALKEELDRLGVFSQYEDRFLDLFRRAE